MNIASGAVLEFDTAAANRIYAGVLSGAGDLNKVSVNQLQLSGDSASTFSGTTTVNGGVYMCQVHDTVRKYCLEDGFFELGSSTSLGSSYSGTISLVVDCLAWAGERFHLNTPAQWQYKIEVLGPSDGSRTYSLVNEHGGSPGCSLATWFGWR